MLLISMVADTTPYLVNFINLHAFVILQVDVVAVPSNILVRQFRDATSCLHLLK